MKTTRTILIVAAIDIILVSVGVAGTRANLLCGGRAWLSATMASIGIVTFLGLFCGLLPNRTDVDDRMTECVIRRALAGGIVTTYLVLVATTAFFMSGGNAGSAASDRLPRLTESLLTSFTGIVGVVIAFYFGASAYVEGKVKTSKNEKPANADPGD